MRKIYHKQLPLGPAPLKHDHAQELEAISAQLDRLPDAAPLIHADLVRHLSSPTLGREGLSGDQVLRILIIKQMNGYSYEELAFHLEDSASYRRFCRLGFGDAPSDTVLQRDIKRIRPDTLEGINRMLVADAAASGIDTGRKVRVDCTVMESNIHEPRDSSLLWDCVRVLTRTLHRARKLVDVQFVDHTRMAKRRSLAISHAKNSKIRTRKYRDLLAATERTVGYARKAVETLQKAQVMDVMDLIKCEALAHELSHFSDLAVRVIDQTTRRVIHGEAVPVADKIVSIFEVHTDIIVKKRRETLFGHKLCLSGGASGLISDLVTEDGNPADSTLAVRMARRQIDIYGRPPDKMAYDGGFASKKNLKDIKALGVKDVAFSKKCGLQVLDMVKSTWVYRQLKRFRAGIEGCISFLKRSLGLSRCTWRSLESFKAYAWASVITGNLLVIARQ